MANIDYGVDPLTIGSVSFAIEECPESFPLGVTGAVVKHVKVGGGTDTQKMGARTRDISWEGQFFENALTQHAALSVLCQSQQTVPITWNVNGIRKYNGIIAEYYAEFHDRNHADYHISLSLTDYKATSGPASSGNNVDGAVSTQSGAFSDSYNQVVAIDPTAAAALPNPADLNAQIQALGPIAQAAGSTASVESYLNGAIASVTQYMNGLPGLSAAIGPTGKMLANLQLIYGNVQNGQSVKSVLLDPADTSLFRLAARDTGEPSFAYVIAQANGQAFPFLQRGVATRLMISPYASST